MRAIVFYAFLFVFLTLGISSVITTLTTNTYYEYDMYFSPGIYNFSADGHYTYTPGGAYAVLDTNGIIEVNDSVYVNSTTLIPGYYQVVVIPAENNILPFYILSLMISSLISLLIIAALHRLLLKLAERNT